MTDVEAKTPPKRKSFSNAENKKSSAKKPKLDNAKTPQKNNLTKQKFNKKNKNKSGDDSPKKLKPFGGTKNIDIKVEKSPKQKVTDDKGEEKKKSKRRNTFHILELQIKADKDEALEKIEGKIKAIESRDQITKSARRKLKLLQRLRKIANGEPLERPQQKQKEAYSKAESTKRRERKKNAKKLVVGTDLEKTSVKSSQQLDVKTNGKANKNKKVQKTNPQKEVEEEDDSDEDVEEESDEDVEEEEDDSVDEEEVSGEGEEQDDDSDDEAEEEEESDDDEEEESEEESPPPPPKISNLKNKPLNKKKPDVGKTNTKNKNDAKDKTPDLAGLKKNNLLEKNQKRYVLFVGNIPYDTNKLDLIEHFKKSGEIKHIRIPTEKKSSKPRGFAYVELANEESYQKCLSMHHTHLKGRRINVLYTQGGKKKGDDKKKEIKAKNFKLHAMRKQGQLAGSKKDSQKRSFRRLKKKAGEHNEQQET